MPNNGAAVALPLGLDPTAAKPTEVIERIGRVVADAALATYQATWEHADGGMSPATRTKAGDLFVQLYKLQETFGELDFHATARREGRRVLQERYGEALQRQYGQATLDTAIDEIIGWPLDILTKVTAYERARAH